MGSARHVGDSFVATLGSTLWTAPEILSATQGFQVPRLAKEDIWSLGITILELADGVPPYIDLSTAEAIVHITNLTEPPPSFKAASLWSTSLNTFLEQCLVKEVHHRASAQVLLGFPFLLDADKYDFSRIMSLTVLLPFLYGTDKARHLEIDPLFDALGLLAHLLSQTAAQRRPFLPFLLLLLP